MNWRAPAYFLLHRLIGSDVRAAYDEFRRMAYAGRSAVRAVAEARLAEVLRGAAVVPFYRERLGGRAPELESFPILTKADFLENFEALMTDDLRASWSGGGGRRRYDWTVVSTGGTTGTPTRVIHDRDYRDRGRASRLFSQWLCGFPLGTPYYMLWGSMRDVNASKESAVQRVQRLLLNARVLNAFRMDDDRMRGYLAGMGRGGVRHLMGYVDACERLVDFAEREGLRVPPMDSLMSCAGTLVPEVRAKLERAFGTRVHNKYGSRECTDMACDCSEGRLHWFSHHVHLEVVDDLGRAVPVGETGRILVTLLGNRSFPMIRYEIGDMGALDDSVCGCGLSFPLLRHVAGRQVEFVTDGRGNRVTPVYIRHLIGVVHHPGEVLKRFQLNQTAPGRFELLVAMDESGRGAYERERWPLVRRDLEEVLGPGAGVTLEFRDEIEAGDSGKFLYVRNRMAASAPGGHGDGGGTGA